jgi:sialic acid synthase SpsE/quercetin dioxygenase-like cupin family protein
VNPGFDFDGLFVLDLANNHQGSVEHGLRIIRAVAEVVKRHGVRAAVKFQFRQLDTFIHPAHRSGSELGYVKRFSSTRLERDQFRTLLEEVRTQGMLAACTPFDEESVAVIGEMGFDLVKVASCSAKDWPLLEEIASSGRPVVCSTGGLGLSDVDALVSFFGHRGVHFALMHCVSIYPTPDEHMNLAQIRTLRERHPAVSIGWSTHERPSDTVPVALAVAAGATLFERHVGVKTPEIELNAYSSTPEELDAWLAAHRRATVLFGAAVRPPTAKEERDSIDALRRGVYARRALRRGERIERRDVYFAMPYVAGQLESGAWKDGIVLLEDVAPDAPLGRDRLETPAQGDVAVVKQAVHEVKALLNEARIALGSDFKVEYSHHYGLSRFRETGAVIVECINREYCKKLVVQLPGQRHPAHYHARKEETFQVLHGTLVSELDGKRRELHPGDTLLVLPGVWHSFWTATGVVFEEISTTHFDDDSFYEDKRINKMARSERKTIVDHWGRFQLAGANGARSWSEP